MMLPEWLTEQEKGLPPTPVRGKYRRGFLDKTIVGIGELIQNTLLSEKYASREGFMQGLTARTKIIFMVALVLTASFARRLEVLLILYIILLMLSSVSHIPLSFFIFRVWLFIPLFSAFIVAPAMLNLFTPGDPLIAISDGIYITRQGVHAAVFFTMRVAVSVSAVVLVQLVTKWHDLLASLSSLSVPALFILILEMCYRYIILLAEIVTDMHLAKKSRTIEPSSTSAGQKWVGGSMAFLFRKSFALSGHVYNAMVARGYTGEVRSETPTSLNSRDYAFLACTLLACMMLLLLERVFL
jgi:cobalt/nickel transport system permease protein